MDLCLRARAAGIPTVLDPAVRVRHVGGHATRPVYDGEPHELLARRRREVVGANRGARGAPRSTTSPRRSRSPRGPPGGSRSAADADRERAQLAAVLRARAQ